MQKSSINLLLLLLSLWSASLPAAVDGIPEVGIERPPLRAGASGPLLLVENGKGDRESSSPTSGTLVLPENQLAPEDKPGDKKCMTVCARWGKDCQYIDRGSGGLTEKCRRTCKQFTEECF